MRKKNRKKSSRRDFLRLGASAGAATLTGLSGAGMFLSGNSDDEGKKGRGKMGWRDGVDFVDLVDLVDGVD